MTRFPRRLLLTALLAASGAVALAQTSPPAATGNASAQPAAGQRHGRMNKDPAEMQQRMAERHERRMADLKSALNLKPDQENAWNTFAEAMKPPARPASQTMSRAEFDQLTTPERIELKEKRRAERDAHIAQRDEAIKAFYTQLTPEQQKVFDAQRPHKGPAGRGN